MVYIEGGFRGGRFAWRMHGGSSGLLGVAVRRWMESDGRRICGAKCGEIKPSAVIMDGCGRMVGLNFGRR